MASLVDQASDPNTPFTRLLKLSSSKWLDVLCALAENPSIFVEKDGELGLTIPSRLAERVPDNLVNNSGLFLIYEAGSIDMFPFLATVMGRLRDPQNIETLFFGLCDMRAGVAVKTQSALVFNTAVNRNTPISVLRAIAETDVDITNLAHVAMNPNCDADTLVYLANKNFRLSSYVAKNPNVPSELEKALILSGVQDVLRHLAKHSRNPSTLRTMFQEKSLIVDVASNPSIPMDLEREILTKGDALSKWAMAAHSERPETLRTLSKESDESVRIAVASNPDTPSDVVSTLMFVDTESSHHVRHRAVLHRDSDRKVSASPRSLKRISEDVREHREIRDAAKEVLDNWRKSLGLGRGIFENDVSPCKHARCSTYRFPDLPLGPVRVSPAALPRSAIDQGGLRAGLHQPGCDGVRTGRIDTWRQDVPRVVRLLPDHSGRDRSHLLEAKPQLRGR